MNLSGPHRSDLFPPRGARTRFGRVFASFAPLRGPAIAAMLGVVALMATPDVHAQRAFARRFPAPAAQPVTVKGDIVLLGNHTLSCDPANATTGAACATALASPTTGRNNDFAAVAVNVDPDGGNNVSSSSATLNLPAGSTVLFAGLYWSGESADTVARSTVRMRVPGGSYATQNADVTDAIGNAYQSFDDVTSIVAASGNGVYTVANVAQTASGTGHWGGWTLVVAYQNNTSGTLRNLSVFDGLIYGNGTPAFQDINISGFYTPISGTVNTNLGLVVYDGDRGQSDGGNSLEFGPNTGALAAVSDAANPVTDVWNSSISFQGTPVTAGRTPASINLLGVDIDNIKPATPLPYGSSAAVLRVRATSGDVNYPGVVTLATDAFEPEIVTSFTKTATNDNGTTTFRPGDVVTYTISLTNRGNDNSNNTRIADPLPSGVSYVPGSLEVVSGANVGAKTDAVGDDEAEYVAGTRTINFRVGNTADATSGGVVAPTAGTQVRFKVVVNPVVDGASLANVANVSYVSATSGATGTGSTPPSTFSVTNQADVSITKTGPATVEPGAPIRYVVTVSSAGPAASDGATVTDNVPAGLTGVTIGCVATGGAACPSTAGLTTLAAVAIPTLPSGGSVAFTIDATAPASPTTLSNSASVAMPAGVGDPTPANNTAGPVGTIVATPVDVAVTSTIAAGTYSPSQVVTYTITVTNNGPGTASSVSFADALPPSLTFVSLNAPAGWSATTPAVGANGTINASIANLASGASAVFTLVARIPAGATDGTVLTDGATVSTSSIDTDATNDSATASFTVSAGADVSMSKTLVTTGTYYEGGTLAYTLVVANAGPAAATNVQVSDTPTNLTITGVSGAGCAALPCTIPTLAAGASVTINVNATPQAGTFDNAASVSANEADPNPGNNNDATGNGGTAMAAMDLAVTHVLTSTSPAKAGSLVTYTITVANNGPWTVPGASLVETMPAGLVGATWVCVTGCDVSSGTGDINVGINVPVGGSVAILVSGIAPLTTPSTIPAATASVVASTFAIDPDSSNDSATAPAITISARPIAPVNDVLAGVNGVAGIASAINVLGNDLLDGTAVASTDVVLALVSASNPNVTLDLATGTITVAPGTPAGTYTVTYRLCEQLNPTNCGTANATIDVIAPALAATNDTASTAQNTAVVVNVLANDTMGGSAVASTAVTVTVTVAPQHGSVTIDANGIATYTPAATYSGADAFTYRICDVINPTACTTATANLVVTPNAIDAIDQTVSTPQTGPIVIDPMRTTINGGGAPLDPSSVQIVTAPGNGTVVVNPNGTITFTPDRLFFGTVSFRYRVCDRSTPTPVCDIATVTANVVMQAPQLRLVKTVPTRAVHVGDLVRYTVVVENTGISPANSATVIDTPPAGFTYVEGSLSIDDADDAFVLAGTQPIRINGIDVPVGGRVTIIYVLRVGAGVGRGTHTNSVNATDGMGTTVSNTAVADVSVEGDPVVDDALILGTVFADTNGDGVQQDGEPGLPGVRIASVEGLVIETDVHGRFHVAGVQPLNVLRGSNFVLKVDAATLPPGTTFTTANPLVRRITPGLPVRFDFGVSLPTGTDAGTTR